MQTFYTRTLTSVLTLCLFGLSFQTQAQSCVETTSAGTFCSPRSGVYFGEILPNNGETWTDVDPYDPGMYFRMPVLEGGCYSISTCPTSYDTQIELYQGSETTTPFLYRDDNGPICNTTRSSVTFQASFTEYVRPDISRYDCLPGGGGWGNQATSAVVQVRQNNNLAFTSSGADMCVGETRTLTAVPTPVTETPQAGSGNTGTFSGTGVSGNVFTALTSGLASQTYTLTYTFGYLSTTQDITVYNLATVADAGEDQVVCADSASLNGSYPTIGTGQWTLIAGSGTISNPDTNVTSITGLLSGVPTFAVWTISNGACAITMDTVEILRQGTGNPLTITCPGTQNAAADASCDNLLNDYTSMAVTSDGCGTITVTQSPLPGTALSTGTTEVTLIATDINGNSDICSFDVVNLPPAITGFTNRSNHGLTINWSSDTLSTDGVFVIRYHVFGNSPNFSYKIVPIESATSAYVNGLDENTRYVFRVGTRCSSETMALYSDTSSAWTRNLCEQPTGTYSAPDSSGMSVTLGWANSGADTYKVKMRPAGGSWDYRNTTLPYATFPTMTGTNYEWKVRSICNDGGNRPYGPLQNFSSPSARMAATQLDGFVVYPNPSNGLVTIQYAGSDVMGAIRLTDIMGRVVFTEQVQLGANFNRTIDFNVTPGTYILQIIENAQISTARLDIR